MDSSKNNKVYTVSNIDSDTESKCTGEVTQTTLSDEEWSNLIENHDLSSPRIMSICGKDDREIIKATTLKPWRSICQLLITYRNGSRAIGTGWLAGPKTVVTAGHNVFSHKLGGYWAKEIVVIPGRNIKNNKPEPYGKQSSTVFKSVNSWVNDKNFTADYGAIIMPDSSLSNKARWLGFKALKKQNLKNLSVENSGYPKDHYGTQWFDAGAITDVTKNQIMYGIDTKEGSSGSPVFYRNGDKLRVVGIHTYGECMNKATRITKGVFKILKEWKL